MSAPRRPSHVYVDAGLCILCELCDAVAPGTLRAASFGPLLADEATLDAMAACPTGAIRWLESEEEHEAARRT